MIDDIKLYKKIQNCYVKYFANNTKLRLNKCNKILNDIKDRHIIQEIILTSHIKNNHRGINTTYQDLKRKYYFPKLKEEIHKIINNCYVCNSAKFERNPIKLPIKEIITPSKPHEIIHMDILWYIGKKEMLTLPL